MSFARPRYRQRGPLHRPEARHHDASEIPLPIQRLARCAKPTAHVCIVHERRIMTAFEISFYF
jgi:hypothetical protein